MANISIEPITTSIGAVIGGVDMREAPNAALAAQIRQALLDHGVVFFRNQDLTPEQLWDFTRAFGTPLKEESGGTPEDTAADLQAADLGPTRNSTAVWHADTTSLARPPWGAFLRSVTMPPVGGDTCWSSAQAAYEALSEPWRNMLDGLHAVHHVDALTERMGEYGIGYKDFFQSLHDPYQVHPVVLTHEESGRKGLFVNEAFTTRIVEMNAAESAAVLNVLFHHIGKPEFIMRWKWRPNDVAFWDNRSTQHFAVPDYPGGRVMQRIVLQGIRPGAPDEKLEIPRVAQA
ncbi:MAG: TauD/TfdA dioxygenase family protein [Novosphingobium sp.]